MELKKERLLDVNVNVDFIPLAVIIGILGFLYVSRNK
jgi:hypothetical protein